MKFELIKITKETTENGELAKYRFKCQEDINNTHTLVFQFWGSKLPTWARQAKFANMDPEKDVIIDVQIGDSTEQKQLEG